MAENTQPARCTEAEFKAAREAGLMVFTTADEVAIHKFAELIRAMSKPVREHRDCAWRPDKSSLSGGWCAVCRSPTKYDSEGNKCDGYAAS